jgi:hypothetical protein
MAICFREVPNSDTTFNNEKSIQDIIDIANKTAKHAGEGGGFSRLMSMGKGKDKKK